MSKYYSSQMASPKGFKKVGKSEFNMATLYFEVLFGIMKNIATSGALAETSLRPREIIDYYANLKQFLLSLREISIKELSGTPLNGTEINVIDNSGSTLDSIASLPSEASEFTSDADERMAVIADVHTDPNTMKVLEEAVGDPMIIYVAVQVYVNGAPQVIIARGGTFSYYEFHQTISDRLTDEAWQEMLDDGLAPAMPDWTTSFAVHSTVSALAVAPITPTKFE